MKFEVNVDESIFGESVKDAISRAINHVAREIAIKHISQYKNQIEKAVEVYLAKRLTDKEIKSEIDKAIVRIIEERIQEGE